MNWTRLQGWRFVKPDWRITGATLLFCALTVVAGNWQSGKAAYKQTLQERFDERSASVATPLSESLVEGADYDQRPVVVRGTYLSKYEIFLDNKVHQGKAGYQLLTPLKIGLSDTHVLINRGWIAQGRTREDLPQVSASTSMLEIRGVAMVPGSRFMELQSGTNTGRVWQNLDLEAYRQWSGLRLQPVVIQQIGGTEDGLLREWPRPDFGIDKHRIYALQWYSFCVLAVFLYVFFHFKRKS